MTLADKITLLFDPAIKDAELTESDYGCGVVCQIEELRTQVLAAIAEHEKEVGLGLQSVKHMTSEMTSNVVSGFEAAMKDHVLRLVHRDSSTPTPAPTNMPFKQMPPDLTDFNNWIVSNYSQLAPGSPRFATSAMMNSEALRGMLLEAWEASGKLHSEYLSGELARIEAERQSE